MNSQYGEANYWQGRNPLVQAKLNKWQDLKFNLFIHWGPSSIWGVTESWTICNEEWIQREQRRFENYDLYKVDYENLFKKFNPKQFNPIKWAKAARAAGMRYVVFTTKHHDGFCMFNTQTTDYKITSKDCPYLFFYS